MTFLPVFPLLPLAPLTFPSSVFISSFRVFLFGFPVPLRFSSSHFSLLRDLGGLVGHETAVPREGGAGLEVWAHGGRENGRHDCDEAKIRGVEAWARRRNRGRQVRRC